MARWVENHDTGPVIEMGVDDDMDKYNCGPCPAYDESGHDCVALDHEPFPTRYATPLDGCPFASGKMLLVRRQK